MDLQLAGKRVLVTGASAGIGAAIAKGFGAEGARVAVHYSSSEEGARATRDDVVAAGAADAMVVRGDFTDAEAPVAVVDEVTGAWGGLDILVNNAGGMIDRRRLEDIDHDLLRRVLDLNFSSLVHATRAARPHLRDAGTGAIVNISSVAARNGGGTGSSLYSSSKGAVSTFTRSMSKELAREGIRVNAVSPGIIDTRFHEQHTPDEAFEAMVRQIPLGRAAPPEECVGATLFLASSVLSSYVTGHVLEVNGGMLLG
jgi:3-oxoacyl-[acyl-carrier protein] reductase